MVGLNVSPGLVALVGTLVIAEGAVAGGPGEIKRPLGVKLGLSEEITDGPTVKAIGATGASV